MNAVAHGLGVGEPEALRRTRIREEPLSGAGDDRVDLEVECVDEVVLDQRLRELRVAVHDDVAFVLLLEFLHLLDDVTVPVSSPGVGFSVASWSRGGAPGG